MKKRRGEEFWRRHLDGWRRSGLTQVGYCARHGLGIKSFGRWRQRERAAAKGVESALTLVPVGVGTPALDGVVRLYSPGGWRLDVPCTEVRWLGEFLRQLP